jgi:UDP-GlcNAc3NAcA epimerase
MKVMTVVGARPQFIKAAPVSRAFDQAGIEEILVHTGQHYDATMSDVFFEKLGLRPPAHNLNVGSGSHGVQTGKMLEKLDPILEKVKPEVVLLFGDTNSTLAGAIAAAKFKIPIAHVEAGLRSFNRGMPEEINRLLTDHVSRWLFTPTHRADENLSREGITRGVHRVGDVMYDCCLLFRQIFGDLGTKVLQQFGLESQKYYLATVHRAENTDAPDRLSAIVEAFTVLADGGATVVWPVHPRTRSVLGSLTLSPSIKLIEPLPYFEVQALLMNAKAALTDSGGLQKEAAFHKVPCVTLRDETEWQELVEAGLNQLVGAKRDAILAGVRAANESKCTIPPDLYGTGNAALQIVDILVKEGRNE